MCCGPPTRSLLANLAELELDEPVDAIFSNATFHWVLDHDRLFRRLHAALRSGGRLEAQCGGEGNVAEFERAIEALGGDERFAPYLRGTLQPWKFAGVGETEVRLERAGFVAVRMWLERKRFQPRDPRGYLRASASPLISSAFLRTCTRHSWMRSPARCRARWCSTTCGSTSPRSGRSPLGNRHAGNQLRICSPR